MRSASFSGVRVPDIRASQRQSFAGRISHRVASGLSFANPSFAEARSGTVVGTTINTLCSVIGAGVLSLPLALYYSSIFVGLGLLLFLSSFAAFSVYLLVVGCDATGRYSITEVVAFALYPPQLWGEYLYQKGRERHSSLTAPTDGSSGASAATSSSKRSRRKKEGKEGIRSSTNNAVPTEENSEEQGAESASASRETAEASGRDRKRRRRGGGGGKDKPPRGGPSASNGVDDADDEAGSPPTSAYAGLRDDYARQEWRSRRCRRVVTVLMEFIVFCSNYGTLVIYSKVIADSMPPVVSYITHSDGIFVSKYFWLAAGGVVFFILSCARNMEELKWSSLLGFLTIFYIVLLILYRFHTQQVSDYPHVDPKKYGNIHWMRVSVKMLQTVSTFGLAFSYHYNVPYFYKELQDRRPRRMMESIAVAFPIIIACYALTGVFGYLTFGNEVADKKVGGNIVSNYPENDLPMNIGRLGLFAHFACVFPVVSICTRRGLHRLTMIALTWGEQSALMREAAVAAGAVLTDAEREGLGEVATADVEQPGETSPLLHSPSGAGAAQPSPPGYEVFASSSPQHNPTSLAFSSSTPAGAAAAMAAGIGAGGQPAAYQSLSASNNADSEGSDRMGFAAEFPPNTVDVDRDVGSPDLTTTLAIVIEAAFLVFTTVLIAATVSGIDFVIHIIGTLFSVFIVMVAPGMVGWCVFSPNGPFGSAAAAAAAYSAMSPPNARDDDGDTVGGSTTVRSSDIAINGAASRYRFIRLKQAMCLVNALLGVCITCIGIAVLLYDSLKDRLPPPF